MFARAFIITIILVPMKCLCAFFGDNQIWFHIFVIAIHLRTILNIFAHFSENFNSRPYYSGYALAKRNQTLLFICAQTKFKQNEMFVVALFEIGNFSIKLP